MPDDPVNFFEGGAPKAEEPPPPNGEGDYGRNVVVLKSKKRGREDWAKDWQLSENGSPLPNLFNVMVTLRNHPTLSKLLRYDEMARAPMLIEQIPHTPFDLNIPRRLIDSDVIAIQEEIQLAGLRRIGKATVQDGIQLRAEQERFHPIREYLTGLVWDGTPRLDGWLSYYMGCEPEKTLTPEEVARKLKYISRIGRLFMIALVARIFRPGCKADYMLIFEGPQGALKSSACRVIAGEWFSDNLPDLSRGDAVRLSMHLRGKWLIEIAEMSSFNNAEAHTLKEFLTQTEERYTPKYARNEVTEARQCLFVGSTNEGAYLRDATGARRFWPVKVGVIDLEGLAADRDQLLAEAVHLFQAGEQWWPDRDFEREVIAPEQDARYEEHPWREAIETWVTQNAIHRCTVNSVLTGPLNMLQGQIGTRQQREVSAIFARMKWTKSRSGGKDWYNRPTAGDSA